jgi:hypothetical protein
MNLINQKELLEMMKYNKIAGENVEKVQITEFEGLVIVGITNLEDNTVEILNCKPTESGALQKVVAYIDGQVVMMDKELTLEQTSRIETLELELIEGGYYFE